MIQYVSNCTRCGKIALSEYYLGKSRCAECAKIPDTTFQVWDGFADLADLVSRFEICGAEADNLRGSEVIIARIDTDGYEETAFVLFQMPNGTLFEVNASHCSCYDFEGDWQPEATTWAALAIRENTNWPAGFVAHVKAQAAAAPPVKP